MFCDLCFKLLRFRLLTNHQLMLLHVMLLGESSRGHKIKGKGLMALWVTSGESRVGNELSSDLVTIQLVMRKISFVIICNNFQKCLYFYEQLVVNMQEGSGWYKTKTTHF